jgi:hypothetical protein
VILGIPKKTLIIIGAIAVVVFIFAVSKKNEADAQGSATGCKVSVTADVLNARETAAGDGKVVGKYLRGAEFDAQPVVQNGFRKIADDKWVANSFVQPVAGAKC